MSARRAPAGPKSAPHPAPRTAPAPSLRHPAMIAAVLVAAACVGFSVTFRIIDSDFWQHLLVGRVIWETGAIPREHLWSWVSYGRPEVLPSWLFRWALWPFYSAGGVEGLFVWRWLTTFAAFGLAWATARKLGARGFVPLVVLAWCALAYRSRSQVRPETLAAALLVAEIWILERARRGGRGGLPWLVPIAWVWSSAHVSYFLGFVLLGVHALPALLQRRPRGEASGPTLRHLGLAALAMAAVSLANPFGWEQLWQPFDYALNLSRETLFRGIGELQPVNLSTGWRYGLWIMVVGWPLLFLLRVRREGWDWVEAATLALVTAYALPSQRFLGVYALVAAPYLGRDLEYFVKGRRWPRWTSPPFARAALASVACVAIGVPEWARPVLTPGVGVAIERFPVAACDFIERHGVRGRGFEHFRFVGYQAWRFWPDRERLPFMDIHQSGTPADRAAFAAAFTDPQSWPGLVDRYRLDYALLDRRQRSGEALRDVLDADSGWAPVFLDDAAALYVNRATLAGLADSLGFRWLEGGAARGAELARVAAGDSAARPGLRAELERAVGESRWNAGALALLADLDMIENRTDDARRRLERALVVDPRHPGARQRLGVIALFQGRSRDALAEFERERAVNPDAPGLDLGIGMAYHQAGDSALARRHYRRAVERDPGNAEARLRLEELGGGGR